MMLRFILLLLLFLGGFPYAYAQQADPPGLGSIKLVDLRKDLGNLADDHFQGRESGTIDELKVSAWWAEKMRSAGLKPAGDDGTFFQFFTLKRIRINPASAVLVNGQPLTLWKDVLITQAAPADMEGPVVFIGKAGEADLSKVQVMGKVVVMEANASGVNLNISLPDWRYHRAMMNVYGNDVIRKGAAGIIFISDDFGEKSWDAARENMIRGIYDIEGGTNATVKTSPPVLWIHQKDAAAVKQNGVKVKINLIVEAFDFPSVNIIGKIDGTDPVLSKEYVLFSGHQDAHGIRNPIAGQTIYYGADDNGSVDVAMLAVARAFKKSPGKRSALFVFHGTEERGLMGSRWFVAHSTVPLQSIVAVLNGDMIGRNHPDSAAVVGIRPPYRNSIELAEMVQQSNQEGPKFKLDTKWDLPGHVEFWYFRSDHIPYAYAGVPAVMFSTLLHPDYHTPRDDAKRIDYVKLKKMTEWIYRTGWKVANTAKRPGVDPTYNPQR